MNETALQDIQQGSNAVRREFEHVDVEARLKAPELMLDTSKSVVVLTKEMAKQETKTVTFTAAVPKAKIVKQGPQ